MNVLLRACAVVGWSKVVWFPFITSLKTHFKGEKSGGWKAGAVPRGLTVGNFKYIQLLPLLQVEGGFLGRGGAQFPSLQLTDGAPGQAGSNQPGTETSIVWWF